MYRILQLGKYVSSEHSGGIEERLINVHYYIMHKHMSDHLEMEKTGGKDVKGFISFGLHTIKIKIPCDDQLLLLC